VADLLQFIVCTLFRNACAAEKVDFSRDISPILSDRCFACHGPDNDAQGKQDYDSMWNRILQEKQTAVFPSSNPGDAENSELFRRIMSTDPDEVMPPPEFLVPVTDSEKALIKRWIEEGAEWSGHWAFQKIQMPLMPEKSRNLPSFEIPLTILSKPNFSAKRISLQR
jgi:hypothetical protein